MVLGALLLAATMFTAYTAQMAGASHQPADKVAAAGSRVLRFGPTDRQTLLQETMKLSTPTDLMLQVTAECSIVTYLQTPVGQQSRQRGQVQVWIEIDGVPVSVSTTDLDPNTEGSQTDNGKVVFCDRLHFQQLANDPPANDDTFTMRDFQISRQANGFNWISINPTSYDVDGDNILNIEVLADFNFFASGLETDNVCSTPNPDVPGGLPADDCAQAFVGARTLIAEPTKLTGHEQVTELDADGGS